MQNRNPYAAPRTNVARSDSVEDYGEIKLFSAEGRIGRVRYLGYGVGYSLLFALVIGLAGGLTSAVSPTIGLVVAGIGYIALLVVQVLLTIQRAHDFNVTGWLWLISFIPLAGLVFLLVPGTRGENNYGKQPPPNTTGVVVLACILPIIMIVGILAAVAIPAYQEYTQRVAESPVQQLE
jgi:uncharacterized membrane protein YhaH (DUF805 family)